ncbi:MAG TPA: class I SAM-dependent DNA methyltransferase [Sphingomicrobium sp.]|nr:class I SAM-dependent DNA methyltransferase [Sphingomicrobium sp.]
MTKLSQNELNNTIWQACDTFRGAVDATRYKDLILAVLFWKYLSDTSEARKEELLRQYGPQDPRVERQMKRARFILPEGTDFWSIYKNRQIDNLGEEINKALDAIERENDPKLKDLFRPIDFNSESLLGATRERNRLLRLLLEDFAKPQLKLTPDRVSEDAIGEAYIYLISRFASDAGKKAGEFYTPRKVSELVARLAKPGPGMRICDPACGSGSMLVRAGEAAASPDHQLFGQEVNGSTHALARMNMFLHGEDNARIEWCNTLTGPALVEADRLMQFDRVVSNPPFSLDKWGAEDAATDPFRRFAPDVPPKGRGDYAFILHMLAIAKRGEGRVVCVAPHGVLFRSGAEGRIREGIIRKNLLDAVVGLPPQLFPSTGIPVCLLIFDRSRELGGGRADCRDVIFVDASREFTPGKKQNSLEEGHVEKILATIEARNDVDRYAHVAPFAEIEANGFNLNIPRYVDSFEPEPDIDVAAVQREIERLEDELVTTRARMKQYLAELGIDG